MKRVLKLSAFVVGFVLLTLTGMTITFLIRGGAFSKVSATSPGQCQKIDLPRGSAEDIQPDRLNNLAFLSVMDRRAIVENRATDGTIAKLDLNNDAFVISPALASQPDPFQPHGISLFTAADGTQTLFVINHAFGAGEFIEVFEKPSGQSLFDHIDTLTSPLLIEPNDLVAVGNRQFYVANDSGARNGLERMAEMVFAVGLSPLVYFNGATFENVVDDLKSSGGINVNLAKSELYVGETMGESIRIFKLAPDRSVVKEIDAIALNSGVDNLDLDSDGNIWIANHINTVSLVRHFANAAFPAPTQVQRISFGTEGPQVETIYEKDGTEHPAGSVAVKFGEKFLVGSITEKRILYCQLESE